MDRVVVSSVEFLVRSCATLSDGAVRSALRALTFVYILYIYCAIDIAVCANTVVRRLTTAIRSEKCVVRRIRRFANVIEFTYTNLDSTV